jgi:hypothetical protein
MGTVSAVLFDADAEALGRILRKYGLAPGEGLSMATRSPSRGRGR